MKTTFTVIATLLVTIGFSQNPQFEQIELNSNGDSNPYGLTEFNGHLYFFANDENGPQIWKSDGTSEGTEILKEISPAGSPPPIGGFSMIAAGNQLYFTADDGVHGFELWVSDGTEAGTELFMDINPAGDSYPFNFMYYNNKLYFTAATDQFSTEPWVSDGTEAGTFMLKNIHPNGSSLTSDFIGYNDMVYFMATDNVNGKEMWVTDGTSLGTTLFKDIYPGPISGLNSFNEFNLFNDLLFFSAENAEFERELWVSDGTPEGTNLFKDIFPGDSSDPDDFYVFNGNMYFQADDEAHGLELWKCDGTVEGTVLVKDINAAQYGTSFPQYFQALNGEVFFSASDGSNANGFEFWKTDGTEEGTILVKNIKPGGSSSTPGPKFVYNNKLYFVAEGGSNGRELWQSDGTNEGTVLIAPEEAVNTAPLFNVNRMLVFNNALYFPATYTSSGWELWKLTTLLVSVEEELQQSIFQLFPNPTSGNVEIRISGDFRTATAEIYSETGKLLHVESIRGNTQIIDLAMYPAGIYLVQIQVDNGKLESKKVVKF